MKLSDFDYFLPKELIAQSPLAKRDSSRLMVVDRKNKTTTNRVFRDLVEYLEPEDLLVFNDTKVIPARLLGVKKDTLGKVDVLLSKRLSPKKFQALIKPHLKIGQEIVFKAGTISARLVDERVLEFSNPLTIRVLENIGAAPLPPYVKRTPDNEDKKNYQTIYARNPGAIACPTAGLHFTQRLLNEIKDKSVCIGYVTLHIGLGTFKPVQSLDVRSHIMEPEEFLVPKQTIEFIAAAKHKEGRIFAVGTTTTRALETIADKATSRPSTSLRAGKPQATSCKGSTSLFIYTGYKFNIVDCLLTNFHLPKSTLFMLVCAFAGKDLIMQAYQEAIKEKYRFYSYGDAMLII